ncbi:hypothetical protein SAMN06295909_2449 [Plantibacter sp. VKM Ac-1784]|uniref:Uncharacterized protein n=1 Tax=Plantibacter elymi (nom. nud.) TaxID=199708 RepID=A0ABY1RFZ7_9MICO|nr:hypothetical protein [Plantibacter sp. VKM Ac-1784]SMQ71125.1 hypothetical protein SAMN06295909_2449 [Plantibacter sp. VKM Ac-1784]
MQNQDEVQQIVNVVDRLALKFPDTLRDDVARVVTEVHRELDGSPIRDYVPVLVEREARQRLRRRSQ